MDNSIINKDEDLQKKCQKYLRGHILWQLMELLV